MVTSSERITTKLSNILRVGHGKSQTKIEDNNGIYPILASGGEIGRTNEFIYDKPSVLIGRKGTIDKPQYMDTPFWTIDTLFYTIINSDYSEKFIYYLFLSINWKDYNEASGVPSLTRQIIENIEVTIPSTKAEQNAIANVLTHIDELIASLQKLIEKKRAVKQGAMQELLTGKKRLPGFKGDWNYHKIEDFTDVTIGGTPNTQISEYWNGNILWMSSGELNEKRIHNVTGRITELGLINSSTHMLPKACVLIGLAGQGKTRGTSAINYVELCTNQSIGAILPSKNHNSEYLYQYFNTKYGELRELSDGGGGRGSLNKRHINLFECYLPPTLEEQAAIADILTNMDDEIEQLEQKLAKYEKIKIGMMQNLLTGKIRLPTP